ncbi:16794_t:CDS:2, partial [Dentiscutata erythropus]
MLSSCAAWVLRVGMVLKELVSIGLGGSDGVGCVLLCPIVLKMELSRLVFCMYPGCWVGGNRHVVGPNYELVSFPHWGEGAGKVVAVYCPSAYVGCVREEVEGDWCRGESLEEFDRQGEQKGFSPVAEVVDPTYGVVYVFILRGELEFVDSVIYTVFWGRRQVARRVVYVKWASNAFVADEWPVGMHLCKKVKSLDVYRHLDIKMHGVELP